MGVNMVGVVIIDDDPSTSVVIKQYLKDQDQHRCEVVGEASSVPEALALIPHLQSFAVLVVAILESALPSWGDGIRVASELRKAILGVRIIALSGVNMFFGDRYLHKPVAPQVLARAIFS